MYDLFHVTAAMKRADYLEDYRDAARFIEYCKGCNRYKTYWSCPPFEFDTEEYFAPYEMAYIVGTKIVLHEETIRRNQGLDTCKKAAYDILGRVRAGLDRKLLAMERRYPPSRAFFAGTCHVCPVGACTRIEGKPCIAPKKNRPSLEALGFDIGRTAAELLRVELKWSRDGILPEYLTLVSGFFSRETIAEFSALW
jgi:predicted metal-binding protein